jgi:hypothetical protein
VTNYWFHRSGAFVSRVLAARSIVSICSFGHLYEYFMYLEGSRDAYVFSMKSAL